LFQVIDTGETYWAWFTEDQQMVNWSLNEVSTLLANALEYAAERSNDALVARAFRACSQSHWMRVTGIKWAARAHGDHHVITRLARVVADSNAILGYIGDGQQVSSSKLNNPGSQDDIYFFLPMLTSGLRYTSNQSTEDRLFQSFDDSKADWSSLFPLRSA
jgi:hypothetical protein